MKTNLLPVLTLLATATPAFADSNQWQIDSAHTTAGFSIKHMVVSNVRGSLGKVSGIVHYDGKDLAKSDIDVTIDINSINTNEQKRDEHLKSPDFFDTGRYPTATFKSAKVEPNASGFKITGDLTLHGVTKPVSLTATSLSPAIKDSRGNTHIGTSATGTINRKDFGLNYNQLLDQGGAVLSDDVALILDVELVQKVDKVSTK